MFSRRYTNFWDGLFRPSKMHILGSGEVKTLTNLVSNGNFVDATGWTAYYGNGSVADNTYTLTGDGTQSMTLVTTIAPVITIGHVYAITIKTMATSANCFAIRARFGYTSQHDLIQSPAQNVEYQKTIIATAGATDGNRFSILAVYATKEIASGKSIKFQYVSCVDLTDKFGAGNEPSQTDYENWIATQSNSWFNTTANYLANTNQWF